MTLDEEIDQAEDDLTARYKDHARAQIAHEVATDTLAMAKRYLDQILAVHAELIRDRDTTSTRAGKP
jgi:hypothetical protein